MAINETTEKADQTLTPSEHSQLQQNGTDYEAHAINEKALIRKLDVTLLPSVTILYLLSFLDRANGENGYFDYTNLR